MLISKISPLAGKPAPSSILINVQALIAAYYENIPDPTSKAQGVIFGTSGHRGSSLHQTFNERHILAISQAVCLYRKAHNIDGPLFLGMDTHALSAPAFASALEVFAANEVEVLISNNNEYTPTPVISHAILAYNRDRTTGFADGVVITPSHDPPHDGGFKYNPSNGGPADHTITNWIEKKANAFLENKLDGVKKIPFEKALQAPSVHTHDYLNAYVSDLGNVIDMNVIRESNINIGVDPLGGAGVNYWAPIAARYGLNMTVVNKTIDPTFSFMTVDWDGQIRMDPSSPYAMEKLIALKDSFDIAFACDTDYDRHGIVTRSTGLIPPNHYLSVMISYLFQYRPQWQAACSVGKTIVSSQMIDRVTQKYGRKLYEVPVGFKWFAEGLLNSTIEFCGEESAGASFSRLDGSVWTTDKDGIISALLSAEMTARLGRDPGEIYASLEAELGHCYFKRTDAKATVSQKRILKELSKEKIHATHLADQKILNILTEAPGNNACIGGVKITTEKGWFAARPSGTENLYRLYAESFQDENHLKTIITEAQTIISDVFDKNDD